MGVERLQQEYTDGTRRVITSLMARITRIPVTANQITIAGFVLNAIAAVLVYREAYIAGGVLFLVGSILDIFDGAVARARGEAGPRGAMFDSILDRFSEATMLGAIALVFARDGNEIALVAVITALTSSFMTSYLRARAEALGLDGTHGVMARAERVVLITAALLFAPLGALSWGIVLLAVLSTITVMQRARHVLRQL
ncbi:MAG: CDP-alcohol phosphatidyltransferase family protein [Thermoleophilia bacterium]|nr:CDP-alcohol phosphatidyltransferase family protein [Thermoleophilia bacterium]